jgi:hypothetical protein
VASEIRGENKKIQQTYFEEKVLIGYNVQNIGDVFGLKQLQQVVSNMEKKPKKIRSKQMKKGGYNLPEVNLSRIISRHERPVLMWIGTPSHVGDSERKSENKK